jgi:hypothetical protein
MDTPTLVGTGFVVLGAVVWIVCAIYAYRMAPTFGRSAGLWGVLGIFLGPIALMILYVLPKKPAAAGHGHKHTDPRADLYEKPHKK